MKCFFEKSHKKQLSVGEARFLAMAIAEVVE
jgi:hypothetical protein